MSSSLILKVGEVHIPEDADFETFKAICEETEGWKQEMSKQDMSVWTKANDLSDFRVVKVISVFTDIDAATMYDVLHDPEFRKTWDPAMLEGSEICVINPNNDIGFYELKCPTPLMNRDFVTQRSWLNRETEKIILNHSVNHAAHPPKKGVIRGISYLTGYYIVQLGDQKIQLTYVTQSDPKGNLPAWVMNKLTKIFAPKVINRIYKAAKNYDSWKAKNQPDFKPWLKPEQMMNCLPRLNPADITTAQKLSASNETLDDEENMNESDFKSEDY